MVNEGKTVPVSRPEIILAVTPGDAAALDPAAAVANAVVVELRVAQDRNSVAAQLGRLSASGLRALVRIRRLDDGGEADLAAAMPGRPAAIMLPGVVGGADVQRLGVALAVHEAELGLPDGGTGIAAIGADTPAGVLALPSLPGASPRLAGIAMDEAALGLGDARAARDTARSLTLLAARAAGVPSILLPAPGYDAGALRSLGFSAIVVGSAAEVQALLADRNPRSEPATTASC